MAENDMLRRYLDAGIAFTQMTQRRAEGIVRDLVKAGEVQSEQASQTVEDLVNRSRQNTERLLELVRKEIRSSVGNLGLATKDDIARLESRINAVSSAGRAGGTKKAAKKLVVPSGATKKATKKKSSTKKAGGAAKKA
jgi:polyhydroxyalkanoate synthesis regulator phasin